MMDEFVRYAPLFQLAAYTSLTFSTVIVGVTALIFTYRNNFGWKPIVLVTSHGVGSGMDDEHFDVALKYEVWNRRKYPIVLRSMTVRFKTISVVSGMSTRLPSPGWEIPGWTNELYYREKKSLGPSEHLVFDVAAPFKRRSLDDLEDRPIIRVSYYDPRANKVKIIRKRYHWYLTTLSKPKGFSPARLLGHCRS